MQTEAGWKGLRLNLDIVGTEDGLANYPYISRIAPHSGGIYGTRTACRHGCENAVKPKTDPPFRFSNSISQSNQRLREVKRNRRFNFGLQAQGAEIQWLKLTAR
jgi:hypothetical protein